MSSAARARLYRRRWVEAHPDRDATRKRRPEARAKRNEYQRAYEREHPEIKAAQRAVYRAVKRGDLVRPTSCSACGLEHRRIEAHHDDYSRQLDVIWLCSRCHRQRDQGKPTG